MKIFLSFLPWIVFYAFLAHHRVQEALAAAILTAVVFDTMDFFRGTLKMLQIGTLFFFTAASVAWSLGHPPLFAKWASLAANLTMLAIGVTSIAIKKPFTLQYAKENVPQIYWDTQVFLHKNYVITCVWSASFFLNTCLSAAAFFFPDFHKGIHIFFSLALVFSAMLFTGWYRKHK